MNGGREFWIRVVSSPSLNLNSHVTLGCVTFPSLRFNCKVGYSCLPCLMKLLWGSREWWQVRKGLRRTEALGDLRQASVSEAMGVAYCCAIMATSPPAVVSHCSSRVAWSLSNLESLLITITKAIITVCKVQWAWVFCFLCVRFGFTRSNSNKH